MIKNLELPEEYKTYCEKIKCPAFKHVESNYICRKNILNIDCPMEKGKR